MQSHLGDPGHPALKSLSDPIVLPTASPPSAPPARLTTSRRTGNLGGGVSSHLLPKSCPCSPDPPPPALRLPDPPGGVGSPLGACPGRLPVPGSPCSVPVPSALSPQLSARVTLQLKAPRCAQTSLGTWCHHGPGPRATVPRGSQLSFADKGAKAQGVNGRGGWPSAATGPALLGPPPPKAAMSPGATPSRHASEAAQGKVTVTCICPAHGSALPASHPTAGHPPPMSPRALLLVSRPPRVPLPPGATAEVLAGTPSLAPLRLGSLLHRGFWNPQLGP